MQFYEALHAKQLYANMELFQKIFYIPENVSLFYLEKQN